MATLTVQAVGRAGLTPTYAAASGGGDRFLPSSDTFVHVKNGGGSSITATVATWAAVLGDISVGDFAVTVPAGQTRMIGPTPAQFFAFPTDGLADISYSGVTTVTVAAFQLKQP